MALFPNIFDPTCASHTTHQTRDQHDLPQHHHLRLHRAFRLIRRCSSKTQHEQSKQHESKQAQHHKLKLKPGYIDLRGAATRMFAPSVFLYPSPTHERFDHVEPERQVEKGKDRDVKAPRALLHPEEKEHRQMGAPLCREAEIEKWKTDVRVPEQRWALY